MKLSEVMERDVTSCRMGESLESAASLFWSKDIGVLPVVDANDRVVGMLTDRDVCLSGFFRGRLLKEIAIGEAMSETVTSCSSTDSIEQAAQKMGEAKIRRLPVLDKEGRLEGMVGLTDLVREITNAKLTLKSAKVVLDAMGAIGTPHGEEPMAANPVELLPHVKEKAEKASVKTKAAPKATVALAAAPEISSRRTTAKKTARKVTAKSAAKPAGKPAAKKATAPAKAAKSTTRGKPGKSARKS